MFDYRLTVVLVLAALLASPALLSLLGLSALEPGEVVEPTTPLIEPDEAPSDPETPR